MTTEYHKQPFAVRLGAMGDQAENAFEERHPHAWRTGLNRPDFPVAKLPTDAMRYTPDYMTPEGFFEVMGISSKGQGTLKLKCEKVSALQLWTLLGPVKLWVWDSGRRRYACAPLGDWFDQCVWHGQMDRFPDNKKSYWSLHFNHFPGEWST